METENDEEEYAAERYPEAQAGGFLPVITRSFSGRVDISDIFVVRRSGHCVRIITKEREFRLYRSLKDIAAYLDERFCLLVAGCYINFAKVTRMEQGRIWFENGLVLQPGRDSYIRTRQKYNGFLREYLRPAGRSAMYHAPENRGMTQS